MALTTQCPNCQTRFRVVNDQLKLRGGLVRCGACQIVFNAREHLIDADAAAPASPAPEAPFPFAHIDLELPSRTDEAAAARSPAEEAEPAEPVDANTAANTDADADVDVDADADAETDADVEGDAGAARDGDIAHDIADDIAADNSDDAAPVEGVEAVAPQEDDAHPASDAEEESEVEAKVETAPRETVSAEEHAEAEPEALPEADDPEPAGWIDGDEPGFLRRARRAQRIARISRIVMTVGSLLLLGGAAVQGLHSFGSRIAGTLPATRPYLEEACALLDCRIGLPTQADAVAIESSELQLVPEQEGRLALSVLLRNHGSSTLAWPNIELSLLDGQGKPLVRKILLPADYLPQPKEGVKGFAAGAEQALRVTLDVGALAPTDYRVYLFYP